MGKFINRELLRGEWKKSIMLPWHLLMNLFNLFVQSVYSEYFIKRGRTGRPIVDFRVFGELEDLVEQCKSERKPDMIVTGLSWYGHYDVERVYKFLDELKTENPGLKILILSGYGSVQQGNAEKKGFYYGDLPLRLKDCETKIHKILSLESKAVQK